MHRLIRLALTAGVLVGFVAVPASVAAQGAKLDGMYRSHGKNPDGSEYRGFVEVVRNGDSFVVSWLSPERTREAVRITRVSVGVGIVEGDVLAVSYTASRVPAIATYRIEAGGERLVGQWTVMNGRGSVFIETLEKLPSSAEIPPINPNRPSERPSPRSAPPSEVEERFSL